MSTYNIQDIERLTGIRAHTIRIWEKRYGIATPHRTDTNIRYYDDEQLRKLLNVATLLGRGEKISAVAGLSDKEINTRIANPDRQPSADAITEGYINNLVVCMASFDETGFDKIFSSAINRFGVYGAITNVVYPFLTKTGTLWSTAGIMPAQEHFATNLIKRKLMAAIDGLPPATITEKKFILYLPEGEWHEISLLLSDYVLRSKGYATLYLGQSVPYKNLLATVEKYKPTHILGFYITEKNIETVHEEIHDLAKRHPKLQILLSGALIVRKTAAFPKNARTLNTPSELEELSA